MRAVTAWPSNGEGARHILHTAALALQLVCLQRSRADGCSGTVLRAHSQSVRGCAGGRTGSYQSLVGESYVS